MEEKKYYLFCADDNKYEGMTKEQIIKAIADATGNVPQDLDSAFITQIKELNEGDSVKFWVGTEAEFNALDPAPIVSSHMLRLGEDGVVYVCSDDDALENYVPSTRKINGKELSGDITLDAEGVGAVSKAGDTMTGNLIVSNSGAGIFTNNSSTGNSIRTFNSTAGYGGFWDATAGSAILSYNFANKRIENLAGISMTFSNGTLSINWMK